LTGFRVCGEIVLKGEKRMKESDIMHENGRYWVGKTQAGYAVFQTGLTHSESSVTFAPDSDGLSLAIAHCDYKSRTWAEREAKSRLRDNYKINDAEFAYSPSTGAVGIRWDESQIFRVFNIYYPMYHRSEEVTDWVSVGKGTYAG
jgi:hypothetical protein